MNTIRSESWNRLVDRIYEAATDATQWPDVLGAAADAIGAKSAVLRTVAMGPDRDVHATYHHNMHEPLQQAYEGGLVQNDPYLEVLNRVPVGRIVTNDNMIDLDAMRHTEFYRHYMRPLDNHYIVGGILERDEDGAMSLFGLHRHSKAEPFSGEILDALQSLAPHFRRALWLQRLMEHNVQRAEAAESALEGIGVATFLVDSTGRLVHANSRAEWLLREDRRFRLSNGQVLAAAARCSGAFKPLLSLLPPDELHGSAPGRPLLLPAMEDQTEHLAAQVAPAPDAAGTRPGNTAIYVGNLDETGVLDVGLLRQLYNLTPTEGKLAIALGRGRALGQIARDWSLSRETLRTHLKRVLSKTGTSRQTQLVRLICGRPWRPVPAEAVNRSHGHPSGPPLANRDEDEAELLHGSGTK